MAYEKVTKENLVQSEPKFSASQLPSPLSLMADQIQFKCEKGAVGKCSPSTGRLFLLACMAGMFIAFGAVFYTLVSADHTLSFAVKRVLGGFMFCTGLYLVIQAGSELYTGDTMALMGVWSKRMSLGCYMRLIVVVWIGNLVGSLFVAFGLHYAGVGGYGHGDMGAAAVAIAHAKVTLPLGVMFVKGIFCNILVCLAVWCSYGAKSVADKFFSILLPITCFVALSFEHSVANMYFLPTGLLELAAGHVASGFNPAGLDLAHVCINLGVVTIANWVGGVVFVAAIYYYIYHQKNIDAEHVKVV